MSKKDHIQTNSSGGGGAAAAASDAEVLACLAEIKTLIGELCEKIALGDDSTALAEIIAQLMQLCDKLLANGDAQTEILAELKSLCDKILAGNESLTEVVAELAALCEKLNSAIATLEALCGKIEAQTNLIASVMCPEICPVGGASGGTAEYVNDDNTTDIAVSVGGEGDIKIELSSDESDAIAVTEFITECLAAGTDALINWTNVDGGTGSATLLATAETTSFPVFYNQSTDAAGESGKLQTLTVSHANAEPSEAMVMKTHDQCVLNAIKNIESLLTCPTAEPLGVLAHWG